MNWLRCLLIGFLAWSPIGAQASLTVVGSTEMFGGVTNHLTIRVTNRSTNVLKTNFTVRVFQLSNQLGVPFGKPFSWPNVNVPAKTSRLFRLPLHLPEVRTSTQFLVTSIPFGKVKLTAHPRDLLTSFRAQIAAGSVGLWDSHDRLGSQFSRLGLRPKRIAPENELQDFQGQLLIFVQAIERDGNLRRRWLQFQGLNKKGVAVIFCYDDRRLRAANPILLYANTGPHAGTILTPISSLDGLQAEQQARLVRLINSATRRDPLTLLTHHEY